MLNATSGIAITSAAANSGLIHAQDLNLVNSANIGQYALTPHSNVGGTLSYTDLTGNYYYVVFASSQPSSKIVATPMRGGTLASSPLVLGGFGVVIIGIAVIVIGVRRKSKPTRERREAEQRKDYNMQDTAAVRKAT